MAVTFAVTNLTRNVEGAKRVHRGTITATGTNTAGGDAAAATVFALTSLESLDLGPFYNGTLVFQTKYIPSTGKIIFLGTNAAPGAAVADPEVTAGTSVSSYAAEFTAVGR